MSRIAPLLLLATMAAVALKADLNPESGAFLSQKYTAKDYSASPQNWVAIQDSRGLMFFGNTDGILEFDGVSWRRIPLSTRSGVRAFGIDSRGTLFVGGQGIFGYLAANPSGAYQFVSLLDLVPLADRSFTDVWDVLPTPEGVYFASYRRLFLYTAGGALKVFSPTKLFGRAFLYHGEFFINSDDGLLTMRGADLVRSFDGYGKILCAAPGETPVLASTNKLFHFAFGPPEPFPTGADQYFKEHIIYTVTQLPSGDIAVGTKTGGLVMISPTGQLERVLRTRDGLPSDYISAIYSDRAGAMWVTSDNGIVRLAKTLTSFGERQLLRGSVYAIGRSKGVLYVGTSIGVFRMHTVSSAEPEFESVPGLHDMTFVIVERNGTPFIGTERGLFVLGTGEARRIVPNVVYDINFSQRDPSILYTAGSDGVQMLKQEGTAWKVLKKETGRGQEFRTVVEDSSGDVWATTADTVWHIDFSAATPKAEEFGTAKGVPSGWENVYWFRNHVVFASENGGLLKFSKAAQRFIPDDELGERFTGGRQGVYNLREDAFHNVWITGNGYQGILHNGQWFRQPFLQAGIAELYALYLDPDGTCWASGATGTLFRYQHNAYRKQVAFDVLLRNVSLTNQETPLYQGDGTENSKLQMPYRNNALRFEFAAPFFEDPASVEYQVRLQGSESTWSNWLTETRKDYTNLPEGKYQFRVRARNPHGMVSGEAVFRFSLMPPWYRTWWAYAFYVAALLFAGWLILRWRLSALHARNKWLERVVEERTAEVRTERDQNEALLLNILPKPVASELRITGSVKPTAFEDVTVCFSDFVGFTLSSEKLPPSELINSLNEYFTAFDEIIGRYGLEKLKTIGDAYMFASGLPDTSPSHAVDAVLAALEMVETSRKLARPDKGVNWSIRLGLYSGPVVAGVVGSRKFAFDIWGNTVNFAARMESAGSADRVNLSETTCSRVFDFIECEPRGRVRIKEGRELEMYFAVRPRPDLLTGPWNNGIPEAFRVKYERVFSKTLRSFPNMNGKHHE